MLYFAYGSNLNHFQMKRRCKDSKYLKKINLKGYLQKYVSDPEEVKKLSSLMLSPARANNNIRSVGISDVAQILEKSLSI